MNIPFGDLLTLYFKQKETTSTKIAYGSGVPKTTIDTWLASITRHPRNWRHILQIGQALKLTESEMDMLLGAARHKTVAVYRRDAIQKNDEALLKIVAAWPVADMDHAPFMAPVRRTSRLLSRDVLLTSLRQDLYGGRHCVLYGMPGSGKTSIAIELAYQLRSLFPDGVLWLSLSNIGRVDSNESDREKILACMYSILHAYGHDADKASTLEARSALFREVLSRKQALLVYDDVLNNQSLRDLLPPETSACAMLATSRNQRVLRDRAQSYEVPTLNHEQSFAFLHHKLGDTAERLNQEKTAVDQVISFAQGLPLALDIIASSVQFITFTEYANDLTNQRTRLDYLTDWDNQDKDLTSTFQLSFNYLLPNEQEIFAYVSLFASKRFHADAIASISGRSITQVKKALGKLYESSLIMYVVDDGESDSFQTSFFEVHDLLHVFAHQKLSELNLDENLLKQKLIVYYQQFCQDRLDGSMYLEITREWENIEALIDWGIHAELFEAIRELLFALTHLELGVAGYLDVNAKYHQGLVWLRRIKSHIDSNDLLYLKSALEVRIALFTMKLGEIDSEAHHRNYPQLLHSPDLMSDELIILSSYFAFCQGVVAFQQEKQMQLNAIDTLKHCIRQLEPIPSVTGRHQKGLLTIILGLLMSRMPNTNPQETIQLVEKGLNNLPNEDTYAHLQGYHILLMLARMHQNVNVEQAYAAEAIRISESLGGVRQIASSYLNQSVTQQRMGDSQQALESTLKAQKYFMQIGDTKNISLVGNNLGRMFLICQQYKDAETTLLETIDIAVAHQYQVSEALAHLSLAEVYLAQELYDRSLEKLEETSDLCERIGFAPLTPYVAIHSAYIALQRQDTESALSYIHQGIEMAKDLQIQEAEGVGESVKGLIYDELNQFVEARQAHERAVELLEGQELYEYETARTRLENHLKQTA